MTPKVKHRHTDGIEYGDIYIGRGSVWGNPYIIGQDGTREEVIEKFKVYLEGHESLRARVKLALKGKNLVCFCAPKACHGDYLLRLANE
jgi:hypothetical protein